VIRVKRRTSAAFILISLIVPLLAVPIINAENGNSPAMSVTTQDLNVSGGTSINRTLPARYAVTQTPIRVEVKLAETLLPAAKGEMAVGPRSIGFSIEPGTLVILVLVVAVTSAGMWYLVRRRPVEEDKEE
jgi:hypothetical protein